MSHSVVKDIPPATDNTLVIVVGQDGSLSVDQEILDNLMSKCASKHNAAALYTVSV